MRRICSPWDSQSLTCYTQNQNEQKRHVLFPYTVLSSLAVLVEGGHGRRVAAAAATGREAAAAAGHGVRAVVLLLVVVMVEVASVAAAVVVPVDPPEIRASGS